MKSIVLALFAFLLCGNTFGQATSLAEKNNIRKLNMEAVSNGNRIPNVELITPEGDTVNFYAFKGKKVVVDIWATWCAPCLKEAPHFDALYAGGNQDSIAFISVSIDEDIDQWKAHCAKKKSSIPQYWVGGGEHTPIYWFTYKIRHIAQADRIISEVPTFVIIDPEGTILNKDASLPSSGLLGDEIFE